MQSFSTCSHLNLCCWYGRTCTWTYANGHVPTDSTVSPTVTCTTYAQTLAHQQHLRFQKMMFGTSCLSSFCNYVKPERPIVTVRPVVYVHQQHAIHTLCDQSTRMVLRRLAKPFLHTAPSTATDYRLTNL